jgi:hypothetical protein
VKNGASTKPDVKKLWILTFFFRSD